MTESRPFHILTIGWELALIRSITTPVAERTAIRFTHGLVGDARRLDAARRELPGIDLVALSKIADEPLPVPDYALLASLECCGVGTVRMMVQGDRVLRYRPERESLGYATLLVQRMREQFAALQPDLVLGSFDSLHAWLSLAVAKSCGIPWVAMAFPVIPDDLTGFCRGVTPDTLVPLRQQPDEALRAKAKRTLENVREKRQKVVAYRPPESLLHRAQRIAGYARNLLKRVTSAQDLGVDRFTYPTALERARDIVRRGINHLCLPAKLMLVAPPAGRFVFFPLQMTPESSIDTWATSYQNQLALVEQLSLAIPADVEFVVKLHFSDHDNYERRRLLELMKLPRLHIAHPQASSHAFLQHAALVVTIQGTASLEAALLGKPVLMFGASPYLDFPRTQRALRPDRLHDQIRDMMKLPPVGDEAIEAAFAAYIARYMPGRVNDWTSAIEASAMDQLADCFRALHAHLEAPSVRANWYSSSPFVSAESESA